MTEINGFSDSQVDGCLDGSVIRPGRASALGGVVVDGGRGSGGVGGDVVLGDLSDQRLTDEDVVD